MEVRDTRGAPVADAVVYATSPSARTPRPAQTVVVAQENKQFVPFVTAVQVGAAISFPNRDSVRHHAYSFSPAKKFELPLYIGTPESPIVFDRAGIVTIGCNIHDWMAAYVCVVKTPFFAVTTADGRAQLRGLPGGAWRVEVWQPRLQGDPAQFAQQITVGAEAAKATFQLPLKPDTRRRRTPATSEEGYR